MEKDAWSPSDWEEFVCNALTIRHGTGFQSVPARFQGDLGLDGIVHPRGELYQCYVPDNPRTATEARDKMAGKIKEDLDKLIKNQTDIIRILGKTRIRCWVFATPQFDDKGLIAIAQDCAQQVLGAGSPFLLSDFHAVIVDEGHFAGERAELADDGRYTIPASTGPPPTPQSIDDWSDSNVSLVTTLNEKLRKIHKQKEARARMLRSVLHQYLEGENFLNHLRTNFANQLKLTEDARSAHERQLVMSNGIDDPRGNAIERAMKTQMQLLAEQAPKLTLEARAILASNAVADWLLRCPLDFPENDAA